jgi:cell wall-associated NlpC family hydrolase
MASPLRFTAVVAVSFCFMLLAIVAAATSATVSGVRVIDRLMKSAHAQIGKPYVYGAESPDVGFDCSGLIDYVYRTGGFHFSGRLTSWSALHVGWSVKGKPLNRGDILVTNGGEHVVMYVGHMTVVAAAHTGTNVEYEPLSWFLNSIVDVRRMVHAHAWYHRPYLSENILSLRHRKRKDNATYVRGVRRAHGVDSRSPASY